nr:DUF4402 domain-containing protein [uncultured Holophaga sp.]
MSHQRSAMSLTALAVLAAPLQASTPSRSFEGFIQLIQPLQFGNLLVEPEGGTLTLTEQGAIIPHGTNLRPMTRLSACHEARARVIGGAAGTRFTARIEPTTLAMGGPGGPPLRLTDFSLAPSGSAAVFGGDGSAEVRFGARVDAPAGAKPGTYQGQVWLVVETGKNLLRLAIPVKLVLRGTLHLRNTASLQFGSLLPGTSGGALEVLATGGVRSTPGGPVLMRGPAHPATFHLGDYPGVPFTINLPRSVICSGNGGSLEVRDFTCSIPARGTTPTGGLDFGVGASVRIGPEQKPGNYTGIFTVSVDYQ